MRGRIGISLILSGLVAAQDAPSTADPADAAYRNALKLYEKRMWAAGRRAMRKFVKKFPESKHAKAAQARCGDNCYLGTEILWQSGPPERRIDIAVMGDGFTIGERSQRKHGKWAKEVIEVLWSEAALSSYRNYFNVYFVRLASLEEGVDPKGNPRSSGRKNRKGYSTALDAKAAGSQGQVLMSRKLVYQWLDVAARDFAGVGDDRYVIAFAQFGQLGMAGGGIANVGRPDKAITTHEFGHAFSRLLDEYAIHPGPPQKMLGKTIRAPNVPREQVEAESRPRAVGALPLAAGEASRAVRRWGDLQDGRVAPLAHMRHEQHRAPRVLPGLPRADAPRHLRACQPHRRGLAGAG